MMSRSSPALKAAILTWRRGYPLPTDLWVKLTNQGFNVAALEQRYSA